MHGGGNGRHAPSGSFFTPLAPGGLAGAGPWQLLRCIQPQLHTCVGCLFDMMAPGGLGLCDVDRPETETGLTMPTFPIHPSICTHTHTRVCKHIQPCVHVCARPCTVDRTTYGCAWAVPCMSHIHNCALPHTLSNHVCRYRTQLCNDGINCNRKICFFAHTAEDLRQSSVKVWRTRGQFPPPHTHTM